MTTREEKMKSTRREIDADIQKDRIKKITIILFKTILIVICIFTLTYLYTKYIATSRIIVKEKRIVSSQIPQSFDGSKIIHFSDLHYGSTINLDSVDYLINIINVRNPDLVVFTGNLIDKKYKLKKEEKEKLINKLSNISSTIGKYALLGDNDSDDAMTILKQSGFTFLSNTSEIIYSNNEYILLSFLNDDINKTFEYYKNESANKDVYNILLLKNPDDIKKVVKNYNPNIALSGKSLNGQICLYSDLCFIKKDGAKKYYKEYYKVNNTKLFISSGIGSPDVNMRFMARPSINFFRLSSK